MNERNSNQKSGREELQGKVSRKLNDKIVLNQSHLNGQKNTCMKT